MGSVYETVGCIVKESVFEGSCVLRGLWTGAEPQ